MRLTFVSFFLTSFAATSHARSANCNDSKRLAFNQQEIRDVGQFISVGFNPGRNGYVWPAAGEIGDGFGPRLHPIKKIMINHTGVDIPGAKGTTVVSAKAGLVLTSTSSCKQGQKRCNGGAGNLIEIEHGGGTVTRYLHLSQSCKFPKPGAPVSKGQKIGCIGSTGGVTGPHLHFEVVKNGTYIDPKTVLP